MKECFRCGASEGKEALFEAVHSSGVVDICKACYFKLRIPIVEKKIVDWDKFDDVKTSVRDRLSNMAHVEVQDRTVKNVNSSESLRSVIEKDVEKSIAKVFPEDLVDNFNWVVMRGRRSLKITQKQLAEKVGVSEVIIRSLEQGVLPRDYRELLPRVENVISAALIKGNEVKFGSSVEGFEKKIDSMRVLGEGEKISARNSKNEVEDKEMISRNLFGRAKKRISFNDHEEFTLRTDDFKLEDLNLSTVKDIVGEPVEESGRFDREGLKDSDKEFNVKDLREKSFDSRSLNGHFKEESQISDVERAIEQLEREKTEKLNDLNGQNRLELDVLDLKEVEKSIFEREVSDSVNDDLFCDEGYDVSLDKEIELSEDDVKRLSWGG